MVTSINVLTKRFSICCEEVKISMLLQEFHDGEESMSLLNDSLFVVKK